MANKDENKEIVKAGETPKAEVKALANIDFSEAKKKKTENTKIGLSLTERALIHQGVLNLGNEFVRAKGEAEWTIVNRTNWFAIVDAFPNDIPIEVQNAWRDNTKDRKRTTFLHQSDEFIASFKNLKVDTLVGTNVITQRMILTDRCSVALKLLTGIGGNWTPSKMPVHYLIYLKKFSHKELGTTHKMKISDMNNVQLDYFLKEDEE